MNKVKQYLAIAFLFTLLLGTQIACDESVGQDPTTKLPRIETKHEILREPEVFTP